MAWGFDIDSFLNVFIRLISRRGVFKVMINDNGINFVGVIIGICGLIR